MAATAADAALSTAPTGYENHLAHPLLKTVTRTQGNNAALKDGSVQPPGFRFDFEEVPVLIDAFRRMVRGLEFDVCEMALTTYLVAKAHGVAFTALPVFLVRGFHHAAVQADPGVGFAPGPVRTAASTCSAMSRPRSCRKPSGRTLHGGLLVLPC